MLSKDEAMKRIKMNQPHSEFLTEMGLKEHLAHIPLSDETYRAIKEYVSVLNQYRRILVVLDTWDDLRKMNDSDFQHYLTTFAKKTSLNANDIQFAISTLAGRFIMENIDVVKKETEEMKLGLIEFLNKTHRDQ